MPSYYQRQNRRFDNFVRQVRRNPFLTKVQHAMGISDRSTDRQIRRAGNIVRDKFSAQNPLQAKQISGSGDYRIHTGTGFRPYMRGHRQSGVMHDRSSYKKTAMKAKVHQLEKGEMRIEHSEYIGDLISSAVTGTANFVSQNYAINPGNSGTFPWLSATAINFQDYRFKKLVFEFRPLVSESTSTSAATLTGMGSVIMATQYDAVLGAYPNKNQMENSEYAISVKPSLRAVHAVECNPRFNPLGVLYVSGNLNTTNTNMSNSDIRFQNLGIFQIASSNIPIANNTSISLGEIWVHYDIELYKPQLNAGLSNLLSAHYESDSNTGTPATTTPFGPNVSQANGIQPFANTGTLLTLAFDANGTITFPLAITEGSFLLVYQIQGASAVAAYGGFTAVQGCSLVALWVNNTQGSANAPPATTTTTSIVCAAVVTINAPGSQLAQVRMNTTVIPTGGEFDLLVTPWNTLIVT